MKKDMSRFACGLTAAVVMGTLTACSGDLGEAKLVVPAGGESVGNSENTAQQGEAQIEMKTTVIWGAFDDQFQSRFRIIIQDEAEKSGGITLDIRGATDDVSAANSKLEVALSRKTDVVTVCASNRESIEDMMKKCDTNGVPAVFFNIEPMEDTMSRYGNIWCVGAQAKQSDEMCAQALISYWNDNKDIVDGNGGEKLPLVILQGEIGQQDVTLRTDAYRETLEKNGIEYEILACGITSQSQTQALDKMNAQVTAYGTDGVEGILCNNDSMAISVVQTCINNDYNSGDAEKFVPIVGVDANIDAPEAMRTGSFLGTVLNDRKSQSDIIINVIKAAYAGTEITEDVVGVNCMVDGEYIWIPYVIVDGNNLSATLRGILTVAQSE